MFIPRSKYSTKKTPGREFENSKGKEYRGEVLQLYTGKVYAGSNPSNLGEELFPIGTFKKRNDGVEITLSQEYPKPTERNCEAGTYTRYFLIDVRDSKIYEVGRETYSKLPSVNFVSKVEVPWNLIGPVEDTKLGDYIYPGTGKKNQQKIDQLERAVPGFKDFLSPEQFVR
jgi:hypothetical protein